MSQMRLVYHLNQSPRLPRKAVTLLAVFSIITTILFSFLFFYNVAAAWNEVHAGEPVTVQKVVDLFNPETGNFRFNLPEVSGVLDSLPGGSSEHAVATPQPWKGESRVTILVMGLDYRDWMAGDVPRTDSMWVVTADPQAKTAGMMSIPRDTWVSIPGYDYGKINMAYFYGEAYHLEGGGPALAVKTVEDFLQIDIQYYVQVDFNAFVQFIDKLDGIWVDVPEEIVVDPLGPENTVTLEPGKQRLSGAVALAYARNRYTANGDFDRSLRQMQVINAVRERITQPAYLPVLIAHAAEVYEIIQSGVKTDMSLDEAIRLAWLAQQIKPENIQQATLSRDELYDSWSVQGWEILVPVMDQVYAVRDRVFATGAAQSQQQSEANPEAATEAPAPEAETGLPAGVTTEAASIQVLNGTEIAGLAGETSDTLANLGFNVLDPGNAEGLYTQTTITDYSGKPASTAFLAAKLGVDPARILSGSDPNAPADIVIILGEN